jgi:hypothetical protein
VKDNQTECLDGHALVKPCFVSANGLLSSLVNFFLARVTSLSNLHHHHMKAECSCFPSSPPPSRISCVVSVIEVHAMDMGCGMAILGRRYVLPLTFVCGALVSVGKIVERGLL